MAGAAQVRFLTAGWEKGLGAMFRGQLGGRVLAFVYPRPAPRLFHTFFSPPLRIVALSDGGERLYDRVVQPWTWAPLPASRLIIECDPALPLTDVDLAAIAGWPGLALLQEP